MSFICPRCGEEFPIDQSSRIKFCAYCGSLLNIKPFTQLKNVPMNNSSVLRGKFILDFEKASKIGEILHVQFSKKTGIFEGYSLPEYSMPVAPEGSVELALFFTYVMALDYQTDANRLWRRARETYNKSPELFRPEKILEIDEDELQTRIRSLGSRFPNKGAKAWKKISSLLKTRYGSDPRNLTPKPTTYNDIIFKLKDFPFLKGKKIGTVYIRMMGETGLLQVSDLNRLDVAVDVQLSKLTFYTGVIKSRNRVDDYFQSPSTRTTIEEVWRVAAGKVRCAPWQLDEPIWVLASNLCTSRRCNVCPIEKLCDRNFNYNLSNGKITSI